MLALLLSHRSPHYACPEVIRVSALALFHTVKAAAAARLSPQWLLHHRSVHSPLCTRLSGPDLLHLLHLHRTHTHFKHFKDHLLLMQSASFCPFCFHISSFSSGNQTFPVSNSNNTAEDFLIYCLFSVDLVFNSTEMFISQTNVHSCVFLNIHSHIKILTRHVHPIYIWSNVLNTF